MIRAHVGADAHSAGATTPELVTLSNATAKNRGSRGAPETANARGRARPAQVGGIRGVGRCGETSPQRWTAPQLTLAPEPALVPVQHGIQKIQ
jgi:hypothetical protein